jgi:putative transposase
MKHTPNQGHHQLRKGRHSIPGAYYFVTICTLNKNPILANTEVANIIFESFDWLETEARLKWFCLIVMPDHVHAVIQLQSKQSLPSVLKSFKNFTARQINTYLGNRGSLWQAAYYEHGIRQDESLVQLSTIVTRIQ